MLFGIAWNMFGDGLNDVLEPTSQHGFHASRARSFWLWRKKNAETQERMEEISPVAALPEKLSSAEEQAHLSEQARDLRQGL